MELDASLQWRLEYYLRMTLEYQLEPTVLTFNFLWRALRLLDPPHFGFISVLLNEMDNFKVMPDTLTVYEIIGFCAKYPIGVFPETAFQYMKYYLIIMKDIKKSKAYDPQILQSYLEVWVNARNYVEAMECTRWFTSMSMWNKQMQQSLNELGLVERESCSIPATLTRRLRTLHRELWQFKM